MCKRCKKSYSSKDRYLDLTVTAGLKDYTEIQPARTELFRYDYTVTIIIICYIPVYQQYLVMCLFFLVFFLEDTLFFFSFFSFL